jgi:hypothetical protein
LFHHHGGHDRSWGREHVARTSKTSNKEINALIYKDLQRKPRG